MYKCLSCTFGMWESARPGPSDHAPVYLISPPRFMRQVSQASTYRSSDRVRTVGLRFPARITFSGHPGAPKNVVRGEYGSKSAWQDPVWPSQPARQPAGRCYHYLYFFIAIIIIIIIIIIIVSIIIIIIIAITIIVLIAIIFIIISIIVIIIMIITLNRYHHHHHHHHHHHWLDNGGRPPTSPLMQAKPRSRSRVQGRGRPSAHPPAQRTAREMISHSPGPG